MSGLRRLTSVATMAAFLALPAPANAATPPVFFESFENCTHDESAGYTGVEMALSDPSTVDLWWDEPSTCPGWGLSSNAWLARHTGGTPFPDGDYAMWLNEGPGGTLTAHVEGLTIGQEIVIEFDAATDNDTDSPTTLFLSITMAGTWPEWTWNLEPQQGWTHYRVTHVTDVDATDLMIVGGDATDASPVIDNLCIGVDGCVTAVDEEPVDEEPAATTIAQTGVDFNAAISFAMIAILSGFATFIRRGRRAR